jgi:hypothetical protein
VTSADTTDTTATQPRRDDTPTLAATATWPYATRSMQAAVDHAVAKSLDPRLGANWVPEPRQRATKPETERRDVKRTDMSICRDKAVKPRDQGLLAMQKVEGSSPFSRFRESPRDS